MKRINVTIYRSASVGIYSVVNNEPEFSFDKSSLLIINKVQYLLKLNSCKAMVFFERYCV